jgi:hypothetical protein
MNNEFIKEWKSMREASEQLSVGNISRVCRGRSVHTGGYKWMYKKDYDKYIEQSKTKELIYT